MNIENICIENIGKTDRKFLLHLFKQSYPHRPYDCDIPYKKIRYMLYKYIELGVLELNSFGWNCEIACNFTLKGLEVINAIAHVYGDNEM